MASHIPPEVGHCHCLELAGSFLRTIGGDGGAERMVQVDGSQGFQAGDHNVQVNLFYGEQARESAGSDGIPLRIFVAMPGSTMGEGARWSDIEEIKLQLLGPVAARLSEKLARPTELV